MNFKTKRSSSAFKEKLQRLINEGIEQAFSKNLFVHSDTYPVSPNDYAVYAEDEAGNVVGIIVYGYTTKRDSITITFVYVDPAHRNLGVMAEMAAEMWEHCEALRITYVIVNVPVGCDDLHKAFAKLDFDAVKTVYTRNLV